MKKTQIDSSWYVSQGLELKTQAMKKKKKDLYGAMP